jgi:DNA invertase Pin-like site-specific DNA recombinase
LKAFAAERDLSVAAWYVENESGAKLTRPELFRLLADAQPDDVLLVSRSIGYLASRVLIGKS